MTQILAIDVATRCGWARGDVHGQPIAGSIRFGGLHASANAVFGNALKWISQLLEPQPRPDIVILESMLSPDAKVGATSSAVRDRLAGLHGVIRGVAFLRGIPEIAEASVGDVRAHFIGTRGMKSAPAKRETILRCRLLNWNAVDDNAADALALWSYATSLIDPKLALRVVPMFNRRLAG